MVISGDCEKTKALQEIADLASVLRVAYPEAAKEYIRAKELLQTLRDEPPLRDEYLEGPDGDRHFEDAKRIYRSHLKDAQHAYRSHTAACQQFREILGGLASLVCIELPEVFKQHPVLDRTPRFWHDQPTQEWADLLRALRAAETEAIWEANRTDGHPPAGNGVRKSDKAADAVEPGPLGKALGMLVENPEMAGWPKTKIAQTVGVNRTTLYRKTWEPFRNACQAMKTTPPRGSKAADGTIEAIDDADNS